MQYTVGGISKKLNSGLNNLNHHYYVYSRQNLYTVDRMNSLVFLFNSSKQLNSNCLGLKDDMKVRTDYRRALLERGLAFRKGHLCSLVCCAKGIVHCGR